MGRKHGEAKAWLISQVDHQSDDCLIWPFGRQSKGRGIIFWDSKRQIASRVMCVLAHGDPPTPKHEAAHSCGKGHEGCVNPCHLSWKTHAENMADMHIHGTDCRGESGGRAKLKEHQVLEIRALHGTMKVREIAERYGVSRGAVQGIIERRKWKWL